MEKKIGFERLNATILPDRECRPAPFQMSKYFDSRSLTLRYSLFNMGLLYSSNVITIIE